MNWSSQSRASSLELIVAFCVSSVFADRAEVGSGAQTQEVGSGACV